MSSEEDLFSPDLISSSVTAALPDGYSMRPLQRGDFSKGFLDVLRVLTTVGDVSESDFEKRFDEMKSGSGYHVLVILNEKKDIVGTGALIVERKLYVYVPTRRKCKSLTKAQHSCFRTGWTH